MPFHNGSLNYPVQLGCEPDARYLSLPGFTSGLYTVEQAAQVIADMDAGSGSGGGGSTLPAFEIDVRDYNLPTDGVLDATTAIQDALDAAGLILQAQQDLGFAGACNVNMPGGTFRISAQLFIPGGCTLIGQTENPPYPNRDSAFGSNDNLFTGTEIVCDGSFVGENAILCGADSTGIRNLILDGHAIAIGTKWVQVNVRTVGGKFYTTKPLKFTVNDDDDPRISQFKIDEIEIPAFRVGASMEYQLRGVGGDGNYSFAVIAESLPTGLTLSPQGLISGTPTTREVQFPVIEISDTSTNVYSRSFAVGVILDEIKTRDFNFFTAGTAGDVQLETRWGASGLTWDILGKETPSWLSLSPTGLLSATGATTNDDAGVYSIKVRLLDGAGEVLDVRVYEFEVRFDDGGINIYGENDLKPQIGVPFTSTYQANGGFGAYTWSINDVRSNAEAGQDTIVTPTSPYTGLTLNTATGEISGTTTIEGSNIFYLRATSDVNADIFFEGRFTVNSQVAGVVPVQISRSYATAQKGQAYSYQFKFDADPSDPISTWEIINPPTGLSIDNTGLISGTPVGANYVNGVRLQWSCSVWNCTIRGFNNGAGVFSENPSNIHRIHRSMISACDRGIGFNNQTFDSHFSDLYIFNCRVGMDLGAGAAGLTTTDSRIEFIHEDGINMRTANENDFSNIYFDTCGWSSVRARDCVNAVFTGCRFFRSGRLVRGIGTQTNSLANGDYSNHVHLEDCDRFTFTGNSFDFGSDDGGDKIFLTDRLSDNLRPYVGFKIKNTKELTIVGNNLTGVVSNAFDANLSTFGGNSFKGWRIENNAQTDIYLQPIDIKTEKETLYIPNQSFKAWQRDNQFLIPTSAAISEFPIADYWSIVRGIDTSVDQDIAVERRSDGLIEFDKYYVNIQKLANTGTVPGDNFQTLRLQNISSTDLKFTSNKGCVVSFWARSANNNTIQARVSQYADSADNTFASYVSTGGQINTTTKWTRYSAYFQLTDLEGLEFGSGAIFNLQLLLPAFDQDYDIDIAGVQVDFSVQTPFPQKLRADSLEEAIAYGQRTYQKSKDYDQYLPSWVNGLRYDVNGANFEPSYVLSYAPTATGAAMRTEVVLDTSLLEHPGHPDTATVPGTLDNFKVLNPALLTSRTDPNKYNYSGTGTPASYVEQASKRSFTVSARGEATTADENYIFHWIYTTYASDIDPVGGGYA